MKISIQRKAIAMIELIFAIVVMSFVLLSIPNLLKVASDSGYVALQQESIAVSSSHLNLLLGKYWDENNVVDAHILSTSHGDGSLVLRAGTKKRTTIADAPVSAQLPATAIGAEGEPLGDIDDAHGTLMHLRAFTNTAVERGNIIDQNIRLVTTVQYMTDSASADYNTSTSLVYNINPSAISEPPGTSNIKFISATLTTDNPLDELNKTIVLNAFSSNIGKQLLEVGRDLP